MGFYVVSGYPIIGVRWRQASPVGLFTLAEA